MHIGKCTQEWGWDEMCKVQCARVRCDWGGNRSSRQDPCPTHHSWVLTDVFDVQRAGVGWGSLRERLALSGPTTRCHRHHTHSDVTIEQG